GDLEDGGAGGFAGRAHEGGDADVHVDHGGGGVDLGGVVELARGGFGVLEEVLHVGGGHGDVLLNEEQFAVGVCGELDLVDGGRPVADGAEHLRALECKLYGFLDDFRRHGAESDV